MAVIEPADLYKKLKQMSELQNVLNQRLDVDWRHAGFNYRRAVWVECAELMDHLGWKWWKRQERNDGQILLEVVDIWHFGLSMLLIEERVNERTATEMAAFFSDPPVVNDPWEAVEQFVRAILTERQFAWQQFLLVCAGLAVKFDDLYANYIAKHVLNQFRYDNGYEAGTYIKNWLGQEDNEYLVETIRQIPLDATFERRIREALEIRYSEVRRG